MPRSRATPSRASRLCDRRSGSLPERRLAPAAEPRSEARRGRRLALASVVALGSIGLWPGTAAADYTVVGATVYPGSSANAAFQSVSLSALQGACPTYTGSNPLYLYPGDQPFSVPAASWSVATVLSCGLHVPLPAVAQVQIANPNRGFETLSSSDLAVPGPYQDPQAAPVISTDGAEDQNTYTRPWLGGADANAADQVTVPGGPVSIVVYENGAILSVSAHAARAAGDGTRHMRLRFSATVHAPSGAPVGPAGLTWSWGFGDGAGSTAASPLHAYAAPGVYYVTVQVTDGGMGGTATLQVGPASPREQARGSHRGAGRSRRATSPAGVAHGRGGGGSGRPGGRHARSTAGGSSSSGGGGSRPSTSTPTTATPATSSPATTTPATTPTTPTTPATTPTTRAPSHHSSTRPVPRIRTPPASRPAGTLVAGRLVADVYPLPAADSPLVSSATSPAGAPTVRRAAQGPSSTAALLAGLAVAGLLLLGAASELRGVLASAR